MKCGLSYWRESVIRADLHIHTDRSDGLLTAAEVVRRAHASGLDTVAITDHDAIGGLDAAAETAEALGLRLIPGVELTATHHGHELHLLAYFRSLAEHRDALETFLRKVQRLRKERLRKAISALRVRGLFITESDVFRVPNCESYGRLHLARALVNAGYVRTENEAFNRFLGESSGAVPQLDVTPAAVIALVHELGGLVVWAHPEPKDFDRYIGELQAAGLDGIETHNFRRGDLVGALSGKTRERGLLATGGSDWHGGKGEEPLGSRAVDETIAAPFFEALNRSAA